MERISFILVVLIFVFSPLASADDCQPEDINKDGKVNEIDIFVAVASFVGPIVVSSADVNQDGKITDQDCFLVEKGSEDFNPWVLFRMILTYLETGRYPGDFFVDGKVDLKDLLKVGLEMGVGEREYGITTVGSGGMGDINGDKDVDEEDTAMGMNYSHLVEVQSYYGVIYYPEGTPVHQMEIVRSPRRPSPAVVLTSFFIFPLPENRNSNGKHLNLTSWGKIKAER